MTSIESEIARVAPSLAAERARVTESMAARLAKLHREFVMIKWMAAVALAAAAIPLIKPYFH
jgi:recombinational DNA repair ATPase RecF